VSLRQLDAQFGSLALREHRLDASGLQFRSPHFPLGQVDESNCVGTGRGRRPFDVVHHLTDFLSRLSEVASNMLPSRIIASACAIPVFRSSQRQSIDRRMALAQHQSNSCSWQCNYPGLTLSLISGRSAAGSGLRSKATKFTSSVPEQSRESSSRTLRPAET